MLITLSRVVPMYRTCLVTAHFDKTLELRDARTDLKTSTAEIETGIFAHPAVAVILTYDLYSVCGAFTAITSGFVRT